jgi:hypothetical protein
LSIASRFCRVGCPRDALVDRAEIMRGERFGPKGFEGGNDQIVARRQQWGFDLRGHTAQPRRKRLHLNLLRRFGRLVQGQTQYDKTERQSRNKAKLGFSLYPEANGIL